MVEEEFLGTVSYFKDVWLPARTIVQTAIEKRHEVCKKSHRVHVSMKTSRSCLNGWTRDWVFKKARVLQGL